jgi:flagellar hook-associated protein 1 FlgK
MSGGTFGGINTALRGLLAHQAALDVTSHNIANINTEGYTRQRATFETSVPLSFAAMNMNMPSQLGTGVSLTGFERLRDTFMDSSLRTSMTSQGSSDGYVQSLDQLDGMLLEPSSSGLSALFNNYYSALNQLSQHPADMTARNAFVQSADVLAKGFNQLGVAMDDLLNQSDLRIDDDISQINEITAEIADLNESIRDLVNANQSPNDSLDRRDQLMDQLATLVNYTYTTDPTTQEVTITFAGANLVDPTVAGGFNALDRATVDAAYTAGTLTGGHMFAHEDLWDGTTGKIPAFIDQLDTLVSQFVGDMNTQHALGFDLGGVAGGDLFTAAGTTAATMSVDATILGDVTKVAAGAAAAVGDGGNAIALLGLKDGSIAGLGNQTYGQYYGQFVGDVGVMAATWQRRQTSNEALVAELQDRRAQTSGVSLDEEMSNMMRYQHAYNASARVMSAMDDILDTLINRTGRVGL